MDQKIEKGECDLKANDLAKKTTVLDAIHYLASSWKNSVSDETVVNWFWEGGFKPADRTNDDNFPDKPLPSPRDIDLEMDEFDKWLNIDDNVQTMAMTTEEEIISEIHHRGDNKEESDDDDDDDDDDDEPLPAPPSIWEMTNALEVLKRGARYYVDDVCEFNSRFRLIRKFKFKNY